MRYTASSAICLLTQTFWWHAVRAIIVFSFDTAVDGSLKFYLAFQKAELPTVADGRNCPRVANPWLTVKRQKATQRWQHCVASDKGVQIRKWV